MRTLMTTFWLAIALGVSAGQVVAQETPRARARATLPAGVFEQVEAVARSAEDDGIPGDIVYNKALEGVAKHVPDDRLVPAVRTYASRLRTAKDAFGGQVGSPLLVAGADALQRGMSPDLLRRLGTGRERSPVAVLLLSSLVETGIPADQALSLVRDAARHRTQEQGMLDIAAEVRRLMREGRSAGDAVEQVRRGMQARGGMTGVPPVAPGSAPMKGQRGGGG